MKTKIKVMIQMKSMKDLIMTPMIIAIDLRERKIRVTRSTLKVLKTRTVRKACKFPPPLEPPCDVMTISTIERRTTAPSRRFIRSAAYFYGPRASNFMPSSIMKSQVNITFNYTRLASVSSAMS